VRVEAGGEVVSSLRAMGRLRLEAVKWRAVWDELSGED
jgi:hypothetical protein